MSLGRVDTAEGDSYTGSMAHHRDELIFEVREDPEGGYVAKALGESIFTEASDWSTLEAQVREAVECHYEPGERPAIVRLHFVRDQVLAL